MKTESYTKEVLSAQDGETAESVEFCFSMNRRDFVHILGAGLLIAVHPNSLLAQSRGGRSAQGGSRNALARIHIAETGIITVLTGKIEMGQGARTELSQAAAEELHVPVSQIEMLMGDTSIVPDDGVTAGSRTTPGTVPPIRMAAATARILLMELAAKKWNVERASLEVTDGVITDSGSKKSISYADLAKSGEAGQALKQSAPSDVSLTQVEKWRVMGTSVPRINRRDIIKGTHKYPSDLKRPGMLYGKVLRSPSYGAKLISIDPEPAKAMKGVVVVQDGTFVGVAAPNTYIAEQALKAISGTAKWETSPHPSSKEVFDYLRSKAQGGAANNPFANELSQAAKQLKATYHIPYVQHAPMETRTALAEWNEGALTVWTGTQSPFGYHGDLVRTFRLANDKVRVIVPDFGCGYGGKHTSEAAIEAAKLAQVAGKPVLLRWTREEEFTWAYFRPAAVIDVEASLNEKGSMTSWFFVNINSGNAALETPYRSGQSRCLYRSSNSPLRQGSYRALASVANNFARECFMDELAALAQQDPLDFRLAHLENPRLRTVLEEAAKRFNWRERVKQKAADTGVGIACGTEKGSFVAACVEIGINQEQNSITVRKITEVFECGAVINPSNLLAQVQGCMIMGLGPALREEMRFENGKVQNASFGRYRVPRLSDMPELDIYQLNRPDISSLGGGETPIIPIAPAIANAVYHATGKRFHEMPIRLGA